MTIVPQPRTPRPKAVHRLNLYLEAEDLAACETLAEAENISLGAAARILIEACLACSLNECPNYRHPSE